MIVRPFSLGNKAAAGERLTEEAPCDRVRGDQKRQRQRIA